VDHTLNLKKKQYSCGTRDRQEENGLRVMNKSYKRDSWFQHLEQRFMDILKVLLGISIVFLYLLLFGVLIYAFFNYVMT
jgi:hypothetical protein